MPQWWLGDAGRCYKSSEGKGPESLSTTVLPTPTMSEFYRVSSLVVGANLPVA